MKSLKSVCDEDITLTQDRFDIEAPEDNTTGHVLAALNHMAAIADDLYSALGDEGITFDPEEVDGILNAYDVVSSLHDKYSEYYDMPSLSYDDEDDLESLGLQREEIALEESLAWEMTTKALKTLGFILMKPESHADAWKPSNKKVQHLFGIPMRAGKFADTYFGITDDESKPYTIIDQDDMTSYAELSLALTALKKLAAGGKLQEAPEEEKFVPTAWNVIEALGTEEDIRRLSRMKETSIFGMAEEAIIESILAESNIEDENLIKAIKDFRTELLESTDTSYLNGKEDNDLNESNVSTDVEKQHSTVLKWDAANDQIEPFRLEVIGQDGDATVRILNNILPTNVGNKYTDDIGFKTKTERDDASNALITYFKTVTEVAAYEIELGDMNEAFDETKFKRLASTGLVPAEDVNGVVRAMKVLEAGKTLSGSQKDLISSIFATLIGLVTGDMTVFSKVTSAVKKAATEDSHY